MFIDSSVIAAMMTDEASARGFARRMQASPARMTSPSNVARAAILVGARLHLPMAEVETAIRTFLQIMNIQLLAIPPRAGFLAADVHARFGKDRHAAALDLEDCLTYACAKYYRQPLLCGEGGLAATDIELA